MVKNTGAIHPGRSFLILPLAARTHVFAELEGAIHWRRISSSQILSRWKTHGRPAFSESYPTRGSPVRTGGRPERELHEKGRVSNHNGPDHRFARSGDRPLAQALERRRAASEPRQSEALPGHQCVPVERIEIHLTLLAVLQAGSSRRGQGAKG